MSKFLSGLISPNYVPCSSTYFYKYCSTDNRCWNYGFKATLGYYRDSRTGEQCSSVQLCNCGC
ncbi:hypothetical protein BJQ97_00701 [Geobacillus sp. TFV-3]|nr:hypothetical protein BJQ97_00701 [Geobacillus sp. TFV-3]